MKIIKIFKETGFKIDIETDLKIVNFLDMTFNLINGSYKPYKKPNDSLLYINENSNHPPQSKKKLPKTTTDYAEKQRQIVQKFFKSGDFHASKIEYETALKNSGYKSVHFKYDLVYKNNSKRNRQRNIIVVSTNVAKRFLDLLEKHFRQNNQLHKIFNRNTVKVSYSYRPNVGSSSSHTTKS